MYSYGDYLKAITENIISTSNLTSSVLMFHIGRSGSTVLGDLFNQNRAIFWDSEIFNNKRMPIPSKQVNNRLLNMPTVLVRTRRMRTRHPIYGFEAKLSHAHRRWGSLAECITSMEAISIDRFIVLRRRNHLRVLISNLVGRQGRSWHVVDNQRVPKPVTLNVNRVFLGSLIDVRPRPLVAHMQQVTEEFAHLDQLLADKVVLNLSYEEHISEDPRCAYQLVCDFLDIEAEDVSVHYRKTNPFRLEQLISNFDEVASVLRDSPYEWMLHA